MLPATSPRGQTLEAPQSRLEAEIVQIRAENTAIRYEVQKLEERQRMVLQFLNELQRRCEVSSAVVDGETNYADSAPMP